MVHFLATVRAKKKLKKKLPLQNMPRDKTVIHVHT